MQQWEEDEYSVFLLAPFDFMLAFHANWTPGESPQLEESIEQVYMVHLPGHKIWERRVEGILKGKQKVSKHNTNGSDEWTHNMGLEAWLNRWEHQFLSKGTELHHPRGGSQIFLTPVLGDLIPFVATIGTACACHTDTHVGKRIKM